MLFSLPMTHVMGKEVPEQNVSGKLSSSAMRSMGLDMRMRPDIWRKSLMVIQ